MKRKPTEELLEKLTKTKQLDDYLKENKEFMVDSSLCELLNQLLKEKNCSKIEAIKGAELNEIYGYQIFSGKRIPSRDKLICIAIGIKLSLEETQTLLKSAGFAPLYPKHERDSILIFGIQGKNTVPQINMMLYERNQETI